MDPKSKEEQMRDLINEEIAPVKPESADVWADGTPVLPIDYFPEAPTTVDYDIDERYEGLPDGPEEDELHS